MNEAQTVAMVADDWAATWGTFVFFVVVFLAIPLAYAWHDRRKSY